MRRYVVKMRIPENGIKLPGPTNLAAYSAYVDDVYMLVIRNRTEWNGGRIQN